MASVRGLAAGSARFAHVCGRLGDRGRVGVDGDRSQEMLLVQGDGSPEEVVAPQTSTITPPTDPSPNG